MSPTRILTALLGSLPLLVLIGCAAAQESSPRPENRPPFAFNESDEAFLEEVQLGCFNYFWNAVDPVTGMVRDRTSVEFISVAGVGYQLAAMVVGDERGWVTHDQAEQRTLQIVRAGSSTTSSRPKPQAPAAGRTSRSPAPSTRAFSLRVC